MQLFYHATEKESTKAIMLQKRKVQKIIFSVIRVSAVPHNLSLNKCPERKHSPPGNIVFIGGGNASVYDSLAE